MPFNSLFRNSVSFIYSAHAKERQFAVNSPIASIWKATIPLKSHFCKNELCRRRRTLIHPQLKFRIWDTCVAVKRDTSETESGSRDAQNRLTSKLTNVSLLTLVDSIRSVQTWIMATNVPVRRDTKAEPAMENFASNRSNQLIRRTICAVDSVIGANWTPHAS